MNRRSNYPLLQVFGKIASLLPWIEIEKVDLLWTWADLWRIISLFRKLEPLFAEVSDMREAYPMGVGSSGTTVGIRKRTPRWLSQPIEMVEPTDLKNMLSQIGLFPQVGTKNIFETITFRAILLVPFLGWWKTWPLQRLLVTSNQGINRSLWITWYRWEFILFSCPVH